MRVGRRSEAVSAKAEALGVKLHKEPCGLDIFRFPALEKHYRLLYHVKTVANECNIQGHPQKKCNIQVTKIESGHHFFMKFITNRVLAILFLG